MNRDTEFVFLVLLGMMCLVLIGAVAGSYHRETLQMRMLEQGKGWRGFHFSKNVEDCRVPSIDPDTCAVAYASVNRKRKGDRYGT